MKEESINERITLKGVMKAVFAFFVQEAIFAFALFQFVWGDRETAYFIMGAAIYFKIIQILAAARMPSIVNVELKQKDIESEVQDEGKNIAEQIGDLFDRNRGAK